MAVKMYEFLTVKKVYDTKLQRYVYTPGFKIMLHMKHLMIRSRDLYSILDFETNMWRQDEGWAIEEMDRQVYQYALEDSGQALMNDTEHGPIVKRISDTDNHLIDKWHKFVQRDLRDSFVPLNQKVKFSNSEIKPEDYCSYKLPYPLQEGSIAYYNKLVDVLYLPEEREKFEWAIGSIIAGEQNKIQKFFVFYGEPGSGKSTIISKIMADIVFEGDSSPYVSGFKAENLVNRDQFGTDFLANDPVFAYDDEAKLSRVDTCTVINTIVAHENTRVNPKFGRTFNVKPNCLLFCGSNEVIQLSPNSGFNRRLIDIRQTGEKLSPDEYDECMNQIKFEKSGIAYHCLQVYKKLGKNHYNRYISEEMLTSTSPFHNYVKDNYPELVKGITLSNAYDLYQIYCRECNFATIMPRHKFRDNLKLYFENYGNYEDENGKKIERFFSGFKNEKIGIKTEESEPVQAPTAEEKKTGWLSFDFERSDFDEAFADRPAQYAKEDGTPKNAWNYISTKLADIDTHKLHYVKLPEDVIVIDFDIKDESGEKSFTKNLEAANHFPPTYAELSKSGSGIHLHYIWTGGDPDDLSRVYGSNVEVKVFKGNAALRRQLTKCNDFPIAELSSGLPKKGVKKTVIDWEGFKNERILRSMIIKNLNKEYHKFTKPSIDYINQLLKDAYESGARYDVRDLQQSVLSFALKSTNKADYCVNLVSYMHFCSKDIEESLKENTDLINVESDEYNEKPIIILDIESTPEDRERQMKSLFLICWKYLGEDKKCVRMFNPSPDDVRKVVESYRIVGHNLKGYDCHLLWARMNGYTPAECNRLSQKIIAAKTAEEKRAVTFKEAERIPYADTLDFASAANKKGLKKWEIELHLPHKEMNVSWDQAVPESRWEEMADYCCNDVLATEKVFNHLHSDFVAREILADLSGLTVNDSTNNHTTTLLTSGIRDPQSNYIYTDLSKLTWPDGTLMFPGYEFDTRGIDPSRYKEGVKIVSGKSIYKGIDPGEGGRKIGYPGMYKNVALLDVASMHPHSAIRLNIFGDVITKRYEALVEARVAIKHAEYEKAVEIIKDAFDKDVSKYFQGTEEEIAANTAGLADALKTAANSVYGLTSAKFPNKLRDPKNVDNIVAKYGALMMINLEEELTSQGYTVVHISTDSIKVADATPDVVKFVQDFGTKYGYTFEFEGYFEKIALVNEAVYIAKFADEQTCLDHFNYIPGDNKKATKKGKMWDATGKQFAVPYVYKTLFSHEPIIFDDMCETFNVKEGAIYLDYNEELPDVSQLEDALKKYHKSIVDMAIWRDTDEKKFMTASRAIERLELYFRNELGVSTDVHIDTVINMVYEKIGKAHDYQFVGKVGQFSPMLQGHGGAEMVCIRSDRETPTSPSGSKGYRWLESETVVATDKQAFVDESYYRSLTDKAVETISQYGDFEWFIS